jgi:hypothetical protein
MTVYVQLRAEGDGDHSELRVRTVIASGHEPITDSILRSIPISQIEMYLSTISRGTSPQLVQAVEQLRKTVEVDGFSQVDLERYFEETEPLPLLFVFPKGAIVVFNGIPFVDEFRLEKSADGRITDDFLRNLSGMYLAAVNAKQAPAPFISARANVPVRTVHRWVAEARRRGFLPPATKGRAG